MTSETSTPKAIPDSHMDLIEQPLIMQLATTLSDGTPQVTPVWFSYDDGHIYFNTAQGRLKDKAIRANPYVAISILDPNNPYRYISIRGPVVEIDDTHGRAHIDLLAKRYTGADKYTFGPPTEVRIRYKLAPEHVTTMG
jgi:hypothetical protein